MFPDHAPKPIRRSAKARNGLLRLVQSAILASPCTVFELQRTSGVASVSIHRLLSHVSYRELSTVEAAFTALGADLLARRSDGLWLRVIGARGRGDDDALGSVAAPMDPETADPVGDGADPLGHDPVLATLAAIARARRWNAHRLHRCAGVPYASARRLLTATPMRVLSQLQRLLAALDIDLLVVTPEGDCRCVPRSDADGRRGADLCQRQRAAARLHVERSRRDGEAARRPGRALIGKGEIVRLYRDHALAYGEIARLAGIGRERVRCILRLAGCEPATSRRQRLRRERAVELMASG